MDMEEASSIGGVIQKEQDNQSSINSQSGGVQPKPSSSAAIAITRKDNEIERQEDSNSSHKTDVPHTPPEKKEDCVIIDVKCGGGGDGGAGSSYSDEGLRAEKVCRICHMSLSEENSELLIQLGCGCKGELGVSHPHCAQTWFKHKGNRQCEICGKTAKNITGIQDTRIVMEWNEMRLMGMRSSAANPSSSSLSREGSRRCRPSFCNFLLACLVLAFILPWFFRVDML
ncbi:hypothetical protein CsSME_00019862 [Camellia sinensis var. sinensis]